MGPKGDRAAEGSGTSEAFHKRYPRFGATSMAAIPYDEHDCWNGFHFGESA